MNAKITPPRQNDVPITITHTHASLTTVHKAVMIAIGSDALSDAEKKTAREFLAYVESRAPELAKVKVTA